jgi:hypothetical protein
VAREIDAQWRAMQEAARRDEQAADRQFAFERMSMLDRRRERVPAHQRMPLCNRLGVVLAGLRTDIPACTSLLNAATASSAAAEAPQARHDVEAELAGSDDELRQINFVTAIAQALN